MISKPILFSAPMVRAIIEGRKFLTRRAVKRLPAPVPDGPFGPHDRLGLCYWTGKWQWQDQYGNCTCASDGVNGPHDEGSKMWVKETWATPPHLDHLKPSELPDDARIYYVADGELGIVASCDRCRSPLFMQERFSRITLPVTRVRVERLQDITEEDAVKEGCTAHFGKDVAADEIETAREQFARLWQSINGPDSWAANPYVWVYEWDKVEVTQ